MRLIVDTNRIIAALVKDSASREILLSGKFRFLTVGFARSEIEEHKAEIFGRAKVSEKDLLIILSKLLSRIFVVDDIVIDGKMAEAKEIMDDIDPDDTPFIALALAVENDGIWSDDAHFERQDRIKVWKTKDLARLL